MTHFSFFFVKKFEKHMYYFIPLRKYSLFLLVYHIDFILFIEAIKCDHCPMAYELHTVLCMAFLDRNAQHFYKQEFNSAFTTLHNHLMLNLFDVDLWFSGENTKILSFLTYFPTLKCFWSESVVVSKVCIISFM